MASEITAARRWWASRSPIERATCVTALQRGEGMPTPLADSLLAAGVEVVPHSSGVRDAPPPFPDVLVYVIALEADT